MKSSFFKEAIRLQFNALMMLTIKGTLKQKRKQLSKRKRKIASTLTFLGGCFAATDI